MRMRFSYPMLRLLRSKPEALSLCLRERQSSRGPWGKIRPKVG